MLFQIQNFFQNIQSFYWTAIVTGEAENVNILLPRFLDLGDFMCISQPSPFLFTSLHKSVVKGSKFFSDWHNNSPILHEPKHAMQHVVQIICLDRKFHSNSAILCPKIFRVSSVITYRGFDVLIL